MSHFNTHVFIPSTVDVRDSAAVETYLDDVLAPFDEELKGPRRPDETYTLAEVAENRASKYAHEISHIKDDREFLSKWTGRDLADIVWSDSKNAYVAYTYYNENSKWDWWVIGGRWAGFFFETQDRVTVEAAIRNFHDKKNLKTQSLHLEYDRFEQAVDGLKLVSWDEILEKHGTENIAEARAEYQNQEWMTAVRDALGDSWFFSAESYFCVNRGGRDTFVADGASTAIVPYAAIDLSGKWCAKGEMGWFGMSSGDSEQSDWEKAYYSLLSNAPLNASVICLDLHI